MTAYILSPNYYKYIMFNYMLNKKTLLAFGLPAALGFLGVFAQKVYWSTNFSDDLDQNGFDYIESEQLPIAINIVNDDIIEGELSLEAFFSDEPSSESHYRRRLSQLLISPIDESRLNEAAALVKSWALKNGFNAANFLSDLAVDAQKKSMLLLILYKAWAQYDAKSALEFNASHRGFFNPEAQRLVVPSILIASCDESKNLHSCMASIPHTAEIDRALAYIADEKNSIQELPAEAIAWAQLIQSESVRLELIDDIAELWVEFDPEAAMEWALENDEIKSVGMRAMVQLSRRDPWGAQQILKGIPEEEQELRQLLLGSLINAQVEQDNFETVIALLDNASLSGGRAQYFERFVEEWSHKNPSEAANNIMTLPSGRRRDALLSTVARYWGEQYPSEALDFIATITDQATRKSAMSQALVSWSFKDVDSASDWLQSQPDSQQRDKTIARITGQLIGSQVAHQSVLDLVEMIGDRNLKMMMLEQANKASAFEDEN